MKIADLHKRKRPGRVEEPPLFTPEQAAANRELFMQQLEEAGLVEAANEYFTDFWVGVARRCWILPGGAESVREDLKDTHVDHVLKNWAWYRTQIQKVKQLQEDDVPWLWL